jgi:extradiol dioxygenase family protein
VPGLGRYGHQLVCHVVEGYNASTSANAVGASVAQMSPMHRPTGLRRAGGCERRRQTEPPCGVVLCGSGGKEGVVIPMCGLSPGWRAVSVHSQWPWRRWVDGQLSRQEAGDGAEGFTPMACPTRTDGDPVPVPHFGLVLTQPQFQSLAAGVKAAGIEFVIEPHLRFEGMPGEQYTMFFQDPSGTSPYAAHTRENDINNPRVSLFATIFDGDGKAPCRQCAGIQGYDHTRQSVRTLHRRIGLHAV